MSVPRGKYIGNRVGQPATDEAEHFIKCPGCGGWIDRPTASYLAAFPGFEEIAQESLPDRLSTIVAREDEFEERFPDIFKKRQAAVRGGRE
jgi:hypothetical protein